MQIIGSNRLLSWMCSTCLLGVVACGATPDVAATTSSKRTPSSASAEKSPAESAAPSADGEEIVIQTSTFTVAPGAEVYKCQDFTSPFGGKSVGVVATETDLTQGSHHMFAFVMPNEQLSLFDALSDCPGGGTEFHEYLTTSGSPHTSTTYPAGIGRYFDAGDGLRMNVHLFNSTDEPVDAFIKLTVKTADPAKLEYRAASIFLNYLGLSVPPGVSTQSASYTLPTDIWMLGAASHMHKWGTHFEAKTGDGTMLYQTDEWAEPAPARFDPPLALTQGTVIDWSCTYANDSGQTITFGDSAVKNEMCIFPGEFYNEQGAQLSAQYPVL
ncbi:MAG TPA: hypothetical protein VHC69_18405 [Polyangiaceae bacterium]|nr:hypothetical protein [Polyangiaceae bacterium]